MQHLALGVAHVALKLESSVTAAATGMSSNIYSCQFLPIVTAFLGSLVVRLLSMMLRWRGSVTMDTMRVRKLFMAS